MVLIKNGSSERVVQFKENKIFLLRKKIELKLVSAFGRNNFLVHANRAHNILSYHLICIPWSEYCIRCISTMKR